jgi:hypothetical protein
MLDGALDWISSQRQVWDERFDKLDMHLREVQRTRARPKKEESDD